MGASKSITMERRMHPQALVVCTIEGSAWFLLPLLHRSGLVMDVVTASPLLRHSQFVRTVHVAGRDRVADKAVAVANRHRYDWVIVTEDGLLGEIARLPLPLAERMAVLPLTHPAGMGHLHSKTGLARAMEGHGIRMPAYAVAHSVEEALEATGRIGFPVALKLDASAGGHGTFPCADAGEVRARAGCFDGRPLLVQQWIQGRKLDVNALFLDGRLGHVTVAHTQSEVRPLGVGKVRRYLPPCRVDAAMQDELGRIGRALHAHGFANVTAIEDAQGLRHYFEADMRPNVWSDHGRFVGNDAADAIRAWLGGRPMPPPQGCGALTEPVEVPHVARMSAWDLVRHPFRAWKYRPTTDAQLVFLLAARRVLPRALRRAA